MSKKIILVSFLFAFFFCFNLARAEVVINEIMYNLDGGDIDYFEVLNNGSSDIDLTKYKFIVNNDSVNGHEISINSGSQNLKSGNYGVIVANSVISNYINKWGSTGNIFTASFSLPNSITTTIILKDQSLIQVDKAEYNPLQSGANGDGNSLQLINGSWQAGIPTPGAINIILQTDDNIDNATDNTTSESNNVVTNSNSSTITGETKNTKIIPVNKTKIIVTGTAFTGLPVEFKVNNTVSDSSCGKYFWNFGDGDFEETEKTFPIPQKFAHIYYYKGEYVVSLECYRSYLSSEPDASDEITIKVVPSDISISRTGDEKDFFVEISNNTSFEADISGWILSSYSKTFTFPKNSILKSKGKIIISSKITSFSILDKDTLKLINSEGETVFDYSSSIRPNKILAKNSVPTKMAMAENENLPENDTNTETPVDNLLAEASQNNESTKDNFKYGIFGLVAFLGVSTSATYFIRSRSRKLISKAPGNDFEIMDE